MRDGRVELATTAGDYSADYVISGTGIAMDFLCRPELRQFADNIATWGHRYAPPAIERDERLAQFPYLAGDFSFVEKTAGLTPWISNIHLFSIASTMSFGPSGSSINAMTTIIPKLVSGLTRGLFTADIERFWADFSKYDVPQAIIAHRAETPK